MIRYRFTVGFDATHRIDSPVHPLGDPEAVLHGHHYDAEFMFQQPGGPLYAAGERGGTEEEITGWINRHFHRCDLSVMSFDTTPSSIAAYFYEVFSATMPELAGVTLTVDRRGVYEYQPDPEADDDR